MEPGSILYSGYLIPGDEINIQGGFTVHFQKKLRRYWTLQYFGEGNLVLSGYKDEKSFKRSSSTPTKTSTLGRQRKISSAPVETIRLMTSLKVHKFEMKTKKKVENALIVVSGSHPKFFRPDNKDELAMWHSVFMKFASETKPIKRRVKPRHSPEHHSPSPSAVSNRQDSPNLERDSGVSTLFTRSIRDSDRSSSSSMSSEESNEYSPHRIFPSTVYLDEEDDDYNSSPVPSPSPSPTLRDHAGRQTSRGSRASIFVRNSEGYYEERISSSRESTESGFYETMIRRSSSDDRSDVHPTSSPVLHGKQGRKSKFSTSSSFDNTDNSIPEEEEKNHVTDVTKQIPKAWAVGVENSAELQKILDDDGTNHTYINQKLPSKSTKNLGETGPPVPNRPPSLPARRKFSLATHMSDSEYHQEVLLATRPRAHSTPIDFDLQDTVNQNYSVRSDQPTIPEDIQQLSDVEALMAEQACDKIEVHINKDDLVDSIALVDLRGNVIIAGWSRGLFGKLHVGDHLIQVNDQVVTQAEWANTFIKTSSRTTIVLHISRLPFAKIVNCTRIHEDTFWGIECKANEITHVHSGPVKESGLTEKSESSAYSKKTCEWMITEAANKPLKLNCPKDEMMKYLKKRNLELPLIVQPKDFIQDLNKALNKLKRSSFYHVG